MFELSDVYFSYDNPLPVLRGISVRLYESEVTALVGPNGSGKTTLGKLMSGIVEADSGSIYLDGKDISKLSLADIGRRVGYLFQEPDRQLFAPTVEEELSFVLRVKGYEEEEIAGLASRMLGRFRLFHLKDNFPFLLSRGEKQRLALAAVLINRPRFLILDEPTTALDIKRKAELSEILFELRANDVGMLIISHDENFVEKHADRVLEMAGGEIVDDLRTARQQI